MALVGGVTEMVTDTDPPVRYTSYHSDKTFSILEDARGWISRGVATGFEYNGLQYGFDYPPQDTTKPIVGWRLISRPMDKFQSPDDSGVVEKPTLRAEFDGNKFEEFIETFEIEGKTVKWILEHQKSWKYKLSAKHFEEILTGFSFWFIYRKMPCGIHYVGATRDGQDITQEIFGNYRRGRYLSMYPSISFDVTQYAPLVPGAMHWYDVQGRFPPSDGDGELQIVESIEHGPFETVGELLDTVRLNYKTLREIFDTEYDDGAVCCGMFDG